MHNELTRQCARNMIPFLKDLIHDEENAGYKENVKDLKMLIEHLKPYCDDAECISLRRKEII